MKDFEQERIKAQKAFDDKIGELKKREGINQQQATIEILTAQQDGQRKLDIKLEQLKKERDRDIKKSERELADGRRQGAGSLQAVGRAAAADSAVDRGLLRVLQSSRRRARGSFQGPASLATSKSTRTRPAPIKHADVRGLGRRRKVSQEGSSMQDKDNRKTLTFLLVAGHGAARGLGAVAPGPPWPTMRPRTSAQKLFPDFKDPLARPRASRS